MPLVLHTIRRAALTALLVPAASLSAQVRAPLPPGPPPAPGHTIIADTVIIGEVPIGRSIRAAMAPLSTPRRVLGLGFSTRGTMRDTAGLLITSITTGGAADKAGLNEGDRVVSIDGVDLRVPRDDAGSSDAVEARVARLRRALDSARDSAPVRLELLTDGRLRSVSVMPTRERGWTMMRGGDMAAFSGEMQAAVRASVEGAQAAREGARIRIDAMRDENRAHAEAARVQGEAFRVQGDAARLRGEAARVRTEAARMRARSDGATLTLDGITIAAVDGDFAQQFGRGAETGALVVRTRSDWTPIRAGDVLLTVDGRPVRTGDTLDLSIDRTRDTRIELLRNGRRQTVTLPSSR